MKRSSKIVRAGARNSELSRIQTEFALSRISALINVPFKTSYFSSPGDRDQNMDLKESPGDFFTRDLDEALVLGEIDCALHSAKDVAYPLKKGIDWCWLPWREDPRDVLILPPNRTVCDLPKEPRIGISSERREKYALSRFPKAKLLPIRGNIPSRIAQLDEGTFDAIITAAAAVHRLALNERITEYIPPDELRPPAGQGLLALTFREDDHFFRKIRSLFVKSVVFVGAGIGKKSCTIAGVEALRRCDVCLHDTLMDQDILKEISDHAEIVDVGKRCGSHNKSQDEINILLGEYVRQGKRVVRLKGGDPGIFGRLAEEVEFLQARELPYRVIPGISSVSVATAATGMLLTRRGISRGFCVMTPRQKGGGVAAVNSGQRSNLPIIFFMSVSVASDVIRELLAEGFSKDTKAAFVFNAGTYKQRIIQGTFVDILQSVPDELKSEPGLLFVGDITGFTFRSDLGAFAGKRILITASDALQQRIEQVIQDYGGIPLSFPLIRTVPEKACIPLLKAVSEFDWVILTSPSSVRTFFELYPGDIRSLPKIMSCGSGTTRELLLRNINPDAQPSSHYCTDSLLTLVNKVCGSHSRFLRLRSDRAGLSLSQALRERGFEVADEVLYKTEFVRYDTPCPDFDAVFFASTSAVESFMSLWGDDLLTNKIICAIGKQTAQTLNKYGITVDVLSEKATVETSINALAAFCVSRLIENKL